MDFSRIQELHLAKQDKTLYERMRHELPDPKWLSIDCAYSGSDVPEEKIELILSVSPLESLSITIGTPYYYDQGPKSRNRFPLETIIQKHGLSLQSLSLNQRESEQPHLHRSMLSIANLSAIREACPKSTHLSLDIDRNETVGWVNATLNTITDINSLESVTLRLEIGTGLEHRDEGQVYWKPEAVSDQDPFREPRVSLGVAESLFRDLRRKKQGCALSKVEFVAGDFEDKPHSGPIYVLDWAEGRARNVRVRISRLR